MSIPSTLVQYNSSTQRFECQCNGLLHSFVAVAQLKRHCQTKTHLFFDPEGKLPDLPVCKHCGALMTNPSQHLASCDSKKSSPVDTHAQWTTLLTRQSQHKWFRCAKCTKWVFHTTLTKARFYGPDCFCRFCFEEGPAQTIRAMVRGLKESLLEQQSHACPLCLQKIDTKEMDGTIFEHMNPFCKKTPSLQDTIKQIGPKTELGHLQAQCQEEKVTLVHLLCAQIKTEIERSLKIFDQKKLLKRKRKDHPDHPIHPNHPRQAEFYQKEILPKLLSFIPEFLKLKNSS
jgi:hypothetical protein